MQKQKFQDNDNNFQGGLIWAMTQMSSRVYLCWFPLGTIVGKVANVWGSEAGHHQGALSFSYCVYSLLPGHNQRLTSKYCFPRLPSCCLGLCLSTWSPDSGSVSEPLGGGALLEDVGLWGREEGVLRFHSSAPLAPDFFSARV